MNALSASQPTPLRIIYVKLVAVGAIWGGTFVAGRYLGGEIPPLISATTRFVISSLVLLAYLLISKTPILIPHGKQLLHLAILGFFGIFAYTIFLFYGLSYTTASRASLIVAMNPAMIALASWIFLHERLRPRQSVGILFCLVGSGLVIASRSPDSLSGSLMGDCILLGCIVCWVVYTVCSRSLSGSFGPLLTVSYAIWLGTAMLIVASLLTLQEPIVPTLANLSAGQWFSLVYLGFLGSAMAQIWYYDAIRRIGATRTGAFIALNPVTAVLFGVLLFGEKLTPSIGLGGGLAVLGIYLCNSFRGPNR